MRKSLIALLLVLFLLPSAAFADDGVYPFLVVYGQNETNGYLLGAWSEGQWISPESATSYIKAGDVYTIYGMDGYSQEVTGVEIECIDADFNDAVRPYCYRPPFHLRLSTYIPFSPQSKATSTSIALMGKNDQTQRRINSSNIENTKFIDSSQSILRNLNLYPQDIHIRHVIYADINGDTTEDAIITADGLGEDMSCRTIFFLNGRKSDHDNAISILTTSPIKSSKYTPVPGVVGVLDLNKDNVMEVVIGHHGFDTLRYTIHQLQDGVFKRVELQ